MVVSESAVASPPSRTREGTIIYGPDPGFSKEEHDANADPEDHGEPEGVYPGSSALVLDQAPRQDSGIHLLLRLGEKLHTGKNAWVYAMEVLDPPIPLPPLVAKIARQPSTRGRALRLSAEARAYDVLRGLQGQIVPRCYGHFRTAVDLQEVNVTPWGPDCEDPRSRADLDVSDTPDPGCASLDILLLERLGKRLQDYGLVELPAQDDLREELLDMFMAAADLGIRHTDVSASNILEVAASEPGPPGAPAEARVPGSSASRATGGYRWRIVDWEEYADTPKEDPRWLVEERFEDEIEHIFQHSLNLHSDVVGEGET